VSIDTSIGESSDQSSLLSTSVQVPSSLLHGICNWIALVCRPDNGAAEVRDTTHGIPGQIDEPPC
jgi:hypothetical protein